ICGNVAFDKLRVIKYVNQKRDVRRHAPNSEFRESTTGTPLSCCKVTTACRHFDQHRVKVRRNLRPGINSAAVKPDTRATSSSISCDFTGIWSKLVGWILGSNTALNSGTTTGKFILVDI